MNIWNGRRRKGSVTNAHQRTGPIIQAEQVVKTYSAGSQRVHALRGVDFSVSHGELVAVMGPSGCGKTTLLNCLSGLDDVDSGHIWLEGSDLARLSDDERTMHRARRMGFIFQVYNLLPVLSAIENVELPLLVSGSNSGQAHERAMSALQRVGLEERANHRPAELSGGQRQRVAVARALVNNPAIVWADEPTGALDSRTAKEVFSLLRELNVQDGLTCVVVTHDQTVGRWCDRTVHMRDGIVDRHESTASVDPIVLPPNSRDGSVAIGNTLMLPA